jgi:hypothetical protein
MVNYKIWNGMEKLAVPTSFYISTDARNIAVGLLLGAT